MKSNDQKRHASMKLKLLLQILFVSSFSYMLHAASVNSYVANYGDGTVSVINTATNLVTATLTVGSHPEHIVALPNGQVVYVANSGGGTVSAINTYTNVVATINVGNSPFTMAVTPNGSTLCVCNNGDSTVSVINTSNNAVTNVTVGSEPSGIVITPDNLFAYVTIYSTNVVAVVDIINKTLLTTISVGTEPSSITITPDGTQVYVCNVSGSSVSVISTVSNTVTHTISVGTNPYAIAILPNGLKAYVVNAGSNSVSVIDTGTNTVSTTISVGTNPAHIAVTPDGTKAYVSNGGNDSVSVINTTSDTVTTTITGIVAPVESSITPDSTKVYVCAEASSSVSVINTTTNGVIATPTVGSIPDGILVVAIPDTPTANPQSLIAVQNVGTSITLTGTHNGGTGSFTFALTSTTTSQGGTLSGFNASTGAVTYTSLSTFQGQDTFTFTVTDTGGTSTAGTVYINVLPPTARAYVTDYDGSIHTVSIINVTTGASAGDVTGQPSSYGGSYGLAASPDGTKAYVLYSSGGTSGKISVINAAINVTIGDVADPSNYLNNPQSIAFSPNGSKAYVCNLNASGNSAVSILNPSSGATGTITGNVNANGHALNGPASVAFTPDGSRAYMITNFGSPALNMITASSDTVTAVVTGVTLAGAFEDVVISPDGNFGYLVNEDDGHGVPNVYIFDTNPASGTYNTFLGTIDATSYPFQSPYVMAISPNGLIGYVINVGGGYNTSIIDLNPAHIGTTYRKVTGNVTGSFNDPNSVAFTADGTKAYVANFSGGVSGVVSIITVASNTVTGTVSGYFAPEFMVFLGAGVDTPVANTPTPVTTATATPVTIYLSGSDPISGTHLTFTNFSTPGKGTLGSVTNYVYSGNNTTAQIVYTPSAGQSGSDSFTFQAYNGTTYSNTPTAAITITDTPVANTPTPVTTAPVTPVTINLSGSDPISGTHLTFTNFSTPGKGTLGSVTNYVYSGNNTTAQIVYTPSAGQSGSDSFTFQAYNGTTYSNTPTSAITITDTPVANTPTPVTTPAPIPVTIYLSGSDPISGTHLTFTNFSTPGKGTLGSVTNYVYSGNNTTAQVLYTPNGTLGSDSFTFQAYNGTTYSNTPTASITIISGDIPVANARSANTIENVPIQINISGSDPAGTPLVSFSIVAAPTHGTLGSITRIGSFAATVLYTPNSKYIGSDSFTFKVNNGTTDSTPATVTLTIFPITLIDTFVADMISKYSGM